MNVEETSDSGRSSALSFLSGGMCDGGRYGQQTGEIVGIVKHLIDEMSADLHTLEKEELDQKTDHRTLVKAKTEEILVLAKTIEEKGIRVESLVVEVEKMRSELFEAERALLANPCAKVKGLITCLINGLQAEAPSKVGHASYSDEGTSKATEKEEDLEADIAKHSSELETAVSRSTLLGGEMTSLADGELASELTGSCTEWEELAATPDTIKLLNDDESFKHLMPETPQFGEQLTSERKCLGFGDNSGHPGTSGEQETSQDTAGSPRKARVKQVWMRWEGRSNAMDLEKETEEVFKRKVRRRSDVEAEAGLYMRRVEIDVARVGGD